MVEQDIQTGFYSDSTNSIEPIAYALDDINFNEETGQDILKLPPIKIYSATGHAMLERWLVLSENTIIYLSNKFKKITVVPLTKIPFYQNEVAVEFDYEDENLFIRTDFGRIFSMEIIYTSTSLFLGRALFKYEDDSLRAKVKSVVVNNKTYRHKGEESESSIERSKMPIANSSVNIAMKTPSITHMNDMRWWGSVREIKMVYEMDKRAAMQQALQQDKHIIVSYLKTLLTDISKWNAHNRVGVGFGEESQRIYGLPSSVLKSSNFVDFVNLKEGVAEINLSLNQAKQDTTVETTLEEDGLKINAPTVYKLNEDIDYDKICRKLLFDGGDVVTVNYQSNKDDENSNKLTGVQKLMSTNTNTSITISCSEKIEAERE